MSIAKKIFIHGHGSETYGSMNPPEVFIPAELVDVRTKVQEAMPEMAAPGPEIPESVPLVLGTAPPVAEQQRDYKPQQEKVTPRPPYEQQGEQPQKESFEKQEHAARAEGEFGKVEPGAGKPTQRIESAPGVPGDAQPDVRESKEPPENRQATAPEGPISRDDVTERKGKDAGEHPEESTGAGHYPGEELKKPATDPQKQPNQPPKE